MNKLRLVKMLICCIALILLMFTTQLRSEPSGTTSNISEPVGKSDPFETVRPMTDVRKNVSQRIAALKEPDEDLPDLFVETIMLKFLQASNVERVVAKLVSSQGLVATDPQTNSLVICDTRENIERIVDEIRKADQTPKQIMIEVVIVDVQLNDETEIGVNWEHMFGDSDFGSFYGTSSRAHTKNFVQTFAPTSEGGFFGLIQNGISVTVHALQKTRNVEILASPRVLVLSGQEAEIKTVEEIAYEEQSETSQGGSMTSTKFKEAGITLSVKATITDEDRILMTIAPEQSVNTGTNTVSNSTVPVVDMRSAKTTLLMNDGQVLVMGGLRKKEIRVTGDKIPLLGDLPWIGFLFSNDKTEVKNSELLVLISPHILNEDEQLTEDEQKKYDRFKEQTSPLELKVKTRPEFDLFKELLDFSEEK